MPGDDLDELHRVTVHLDRVLDAAGMTVAELSRRTGITVANLSILKNNRARAVRFSTLTAICDALACQPGDLLSVIPGDAEGRHIEEGSSNLRSGR